MRVAALFDIHANLAALDAVLGEIQNESVDRIVVGGDVLPGPLPRQTMQRLLELSLPVDFLYGNGEVAVLEVLSGKEPARVPMQYRPDIYWNAEQIRDYKATLHGWPKTIQIDGELGRILFCHATPQNENDIFTRDTPEARLISIFAKVEADIIVCGHTHMQFDRMIGNKRVVNAGSVGMPFGAPGADWLLIGPSLQFMHTSYDLEQAANEIRASSYPHADDFALHSVLEPPSAEAMLAAFSGKA
ncbi:MAG: metallophosphoesterase family protein [Acidobacteriaceae bacterium]|nr:metallophosphoesterase family protein [Acidobacteriaceae bacterium]